RPCQASDRVDPFSLAQNRKKVCNNRLIAASVATPIVYPKGLPMRKISVASFAVVCSLATAAFAADEKAKPAAPAGEAPAVSPAAVAAGKKIDWAKMDENAKKQYMKKTVLPTMKKLFVAFDKKHFSNMGCPTCHGEKAAE